MLDLSEAFDDEEEVRVAGGAATQPEKDGSEGARGLVRRPRATAGFREPAPLDLQGFRSLVCGGPHALPELLMIGAVIRFVLYLFRLCDERRGWRDV